MIFTFALAKPFKEREERVLICACALDMFANANEGFVSYRTEQSEVYRNRVCEVISNSLCEYIDYFFFFFLATAQPLATFVEFEVRGAEC